MGTALSFLLDRGLEINADIHLMCAIVDFQSDLKSFWRAQRLNADGVHVSVLSRSIGCPGYVARNRPQDLTVRKSGIPVTRACIHSAEYAIAPSRIAA